VRSSSSAIRQPRRKNSGYGIRNRLPNKFLISTIPGSSFTLSAPEFYKYKSFDGLDIEAALLRPSGYDGKSKLPLIALIHGGPTGNWQDSIETWGSSFAARGYAVFYPNIRGSSGYGENSSK